MKLKRKSFAEESYRNMSLVEIEAQAIVDDIIMTGEIQNDNT